MTARSKQKWLIRVAFEVEVSGATVARAWNYLSDMERDLRDQFGATEVKAYMAPLVKDNSRR